MLIAEEDRLPRSYLAPLSEAVNQFWVSAVSLWEIAIKQRKGKLNFGFPLAVLQERLAQARIDVLPLAPRHAITDSHLPDTLKDPFDRIIVAIAEIEKLTLLTTDQKLLDHPLAWRP